MAKRPMSAYPKEFMDIWELALAGTLSLKFPVRGTAVNLRTRLYAYRKRVEEEAPILAQPLKEVDISMPEPTADGQWEIKAVVIPWKAQARAQVAAMKTRTVSGAVLPEPAPPTEPVVLPDMPPPPETPSAMDDTLRQLGFGTESKT